MRPLCTFLAVAIAICHAHPGDEYGDYVYPSYLPQHHAEDFAHRFRYKEYFPTPHDVGVGSGYLGGKHYAIGHGYPSIGDHIGGKVHYITSSIGDALSTKAHAIKGAHAAISDHVGGKVSYITSGISGHFKGHYDDKNAYADGYGYYGHDGFYGHDGYSKLGAIAHGVGESLSGPIATIKHVHAGISDTISHKAQAVKDGLGETLSNAAHTIQVAHSDLSDHLSRSAVHVKNGISDTFSDTTHTAKTLFGILSEFLGKKVQVIKEGVNKQLKNTGHALSAANAAVYQHIGKKALGVGEFLQNKAHEINVSIQKKLHRDYSHVPEKFVVAEKFIAPVKTEFPAYAGKFEGFGGPYPGGEIGSSYAVSSIGPSVAGVHGGAYEFQQHGNLFQPEKVAVAPIPYAPAPPIPLVAAPQYGATSYTKI